MKIITFEDFNLNEIVRIGKNSIKVSENPIEYHTHDDCYEIIYHYTGERLDPPLLENFCVELSLL